MLREIRIRDLGVIADAELTLAPGLNVITGETGAGKTMLVHGLGLLLGARADSGLVRAGSDAATVEGIVDLDPGHPARARVEELGGSVDEDLVLVRTVGADGRSRAHVGGRAAPVGALAELGESLVAVHGQADQWRLRRPEQHREALDAFGGPPVAQALAAYAESYDALMAVLDEQRRVQAQTQDRRRQTEALSAALDQIEQVDPRPGEDVALRAEDERLGHVESLRAAVGRAHTLVAGDSVASDGGHGPAVLTVLAAAREAVSAAAVHDPTVAGLRDRLTEIAYLLSDLSCDLAAYLADLDVDPARLAWVQRRRAELAALTRGHGGTVDDVLAWAAAAAAQLGELASAQDRLAGIDAQVASCHERLIAAAGALSRARRDAATRLAREVSGELRHLGMGSARVELSVTTRPSAAGLDLEGTGDPVAYGRLGVDEVEILVSAGSGMPPRSVAKAASGGELSRVMLAIELVLAGAADGRRPDPSGVTTFVFDEVDAGVGGRVALDVGARLAGLARSAQVFVVTHLAQVAAYADHHLVVSKDDDGLVTESSVRPVAADDRIRELARMLGGGTSPAAMDHARDLLSRAAASLGVGPDAMS